MTDVWRGCHPFVELLFFLGTVTIIVFVSHPAFIVSSLIGSFVCYRLLYGRWGWKQILGMLLFAVLLGGLNGFWNNDGKTVLFHYFRNRGYTVEAFCYGMITAGIFLCMVSWFTCFQKVMSSEKIYYLLGNFCPHIALLFIMIIQIISELKQKYQEVESCRRCIGKLAAKHNSTKLDNSKELISTMVSWSLENGMVKADAMKSRGYGEAKRTSFSLYRWNMLDSIGCILILILSGGVIISGYFGGMKTDCFPDCSISLNQYTVSGLCSYIGLIYLPVWIRIVDHEK